MLVDGIFQAGASGPAVSGGRTGLAIAALHEIVPAGVVLVLGFVLHVVVVLTSVSPSCSTAIPALP